MKSFTAATMVVAAAALAASAGASRLRERDPSGAGCGKTTQYAGYFDIDNSTDKHYFYWAFESRNAPSTDPIILWMTGGPGCSSELAIVMENGPCKLNSDGTSTTINPNSWNSNANLVYIDQPAGVGYSYANAGGYDSNEAEVAEDMYNFLQAFFGAHPEWADNDFFIVGESYGGHYAPAVSHRVWQGNNDPSGGKHINLKGLAVGNGLTQPLIQYQYYAQLAYNYSISKVGEPRISLEQYEQEVAAWPACHEAIANCQSDTSACGSAQETCNQALMAPYEQSGYNPYDIRIKCAVPPLCYDMSAANTYFNSAPVRAALGVGDAKWSVCNFQVNQMFSNDWMKDFDQDIPDLLENDISVLIYAGDVDFICNWLGNKAWTLQLPWTGQQQFAAAKDVPWNVNSAAAGEVRNYKNFNFLRVYNAGHMVPMDQPVAALDMINTFTSGKPFA